MVNLNNMKYGQFEEIILKIKEHLEWYSEKPYDRNKYTLYLSNGKVLNIVFPKNGIAHLLGIDTEYLKSSGLFLEKNSYDILNKICNDYYKVFKKVRDGHLTLKSFMSEYIDEKILIFRDNVTINFSNIEFICEYSKERSYTTGFSSRDIDYFIGTKIDEDHSMLLGLKENNGIYYPVTSQYVDKTSQRGNKVLEECLTSQALVVPESMLIYNDTTGFKCKRFDNEKEKIERFNLVSMYASNFNCIIDSSDSSIYSLKKLNTIKKTYEYVIKTICECMSKGQKLECSKYNIEFESLPKELQSMISLYNKLDFSLDSNATLINELLEYKVHSKKVIDELSSKQEELISQIVSLEKQNARLKEENSSLNQDLQDATNIITDVRKLVHKKSSST